MDWSSIETAIPQIFGSTATLNYPSQLAAALQSAFGTLVPQTTGQGGYGPYELPDTSGIGGEGNPRGTTTGGDSTTGYSGMFDFPTDIFPFGMSSSYGSSSGGSSNKAFTGLPAAYRNQLLSSVMPVLTDAVTNYGTNVDNYTSSALNSYNMQLRNALNEMLPSLITNLGRRGVLDSTTASNTLGTASRGAITDATTKGYETAIQNAILKAQAPQMLGQLASLGTYSESSGSSSQSSTQRSQSYNEDPTQMWQTLANIIMNA